jgi:SNF2 family DNA or RNA helicase
MTRINQFKYVPRKDAPETLAKLMTPAVRFDKKDCLDMPPITMEDRRVNLTSMQTKVLKSLKDDWLHEESDGSKVVAQTAAVRIGKVLQVCQGRVIGDSGVINVGADERIAACKDLISESLSKTIIFAGFRASVEYLYEELSKHYGCVVVHGDVSQGDRAAAFKAFDNDPDVKVLIAHPATTSHGLTLVAASTTIWYGPYQKFEVYDQANQRTDRPGQKHHMRIINLYSTREELLTFQAARKAISSQDAALELKRLVMVSE